MKNENKLYPFVGLMEGKSYQIVGYPENGEELFTVKRGLLYSLTGKKYSNYKSSDIVSLRFVEYEEPIEKLIEIPLGFYNFLEVISSEFKYVYKTRGNTTFLCEGKPYKIDGREGLNIKWYWRTKRIDNLFDYELDFIPCDEPVLLDDLRESYFNKEMK